MEALDKGGKPTYDRVIRGLDVLKAHDVDWNVLTTVHAANGDHGRAVYTFLRDGLGATFIQFIPIIERATEQTLKSLEKIVDVPGDLDLGPIDALQSGRAGEVKCLGSAKQLEEQQQ